MRVLIVEDHLSERHRDMAWAASSSFTDPRLELIVWVTPGVAFGEDVARAYEPNVLTPMTMLQDRLVMSLGRRAIWIMFRLWAGLRLDTSPQRSGS